MHGGGGARMSTLRSYTRDSSVTQEKITPGTWRRILTYAQPYKGIIAIFLVLLVIDAGLSVAQPLLFRRIIDEGVTPGNAQVVTMTALIAAGVAVIDAGLGLLSRWYSARIGEGLIYDLRTEVYDHVQRQSVAFFTRAQTGALVSRLNTDVIGAQQAFTSTLSGVLGNLITVVVVLVTMFALSWSITLIALALLPLFLLPARWLGRRLQVLTRQQMTANADMSTRMTERFNVAGALLVTLFGDHRREVSAFADRAASVRDTGVKIAMANRYFFTALTLVAAMATVITYGLGGNLVIQGVLTIGTLVALTGLLAQLYGPLTALSNVRVDVMTALVSFDRVFELLDLPPLVRDSPDAKPLPPGPIGVTFDDVWFRYPRPEEVSLASLESVARSQTYPEDMILRGVDFEVPAGTMTALVGPSGAGKTTITALVARLYDATEGTVRVGGEDVRDVTGESLRGSVGYVTQEAHLFHETIRENLTYARPDVSDDEIWRALADAQIADLVRSLPEGLDTVVGDRGHRLSGGEKQRLALARLLIKSPRLVVLDEATAHLDSESEAAVQRALDNALEGRTALVIAHRLSTIRQADQILVIVAGRVAERGTHEQLLAQGGVYADLYRTQFADA